MNAQKYTQKSLEAIQLAQNIALERGNVQIEEAHLLSALLAQEGGLIPQLVTKMGGWRAFPPSAAAVGSRGRSMSPSRWTRTCWRRSARRSG